MLILPPEADESVVSGALDRITGIVSEGGGEVGNVDRWGRRRLAYEIDRQNEGYYVVAAVRADPTVITPLERALRLADDVLRFKVVVREDKAKAQAKAEAATASQ
jgi:small subunit ribosomal protein S6